ncbi:hypothetical protein MAR_005063 [Mya arenaria]|uniref:Acylphosphatase-like domain-containing protein n=1 Tax=Mya arenaria TaxID=6604 RepID=A0ABY7EYE4_MYAAR|nr:hypothetical protein MAR_005027 [Mya arenaria]WAR14958.1 hypothetical protein MAR_005063 [Mya arenaria]
MKSGFFFVFGTHVKAGFVRNQKDLPAEPTIVADATKSGTEAQHQKYIKGLETFQTRESGPMVEVAARLSPIHGSDSEPKTI